VFDILLWSETIGSTLGSNRNRMVFAFFSGLKPLDRPAAVETVEMICRTW